MIAMIAAGTVRAAPTRKGQSWPTKVNRAPAPIGPTIRAIDPEAMFRPSMAPCRSGGDERLAEDITSEAFFRALRRIDSFRGDCDIRVWLCQIAKNCYYTHLKQSRWTEHTADMEQLISEAEESPEEMLLCSENAQQVKHLLHELPDPHKEVFMWRTLGELSFKEIGKLFHKTENWACVTYHRARKMIQKGMEVDKDEK